MTDNIDDKSLYPWGGNFTTGDYQSSVAVVQLNVDFSPPSDIAIFGKLKTENIGIEKIIANVISNPFIRFLIICGNDIRGHQSGKSLVCLHRYGIDDQNRIKNAPGAIPYIENIDEEAILRFQRQIEIIDLVDIIDADIINEHIKKAVQTNKPCFGEPYIAIQMVKKIQMVSDDKRALHSRIKIDYLGVINKRR